MVNRRPPLVTKAECDDPAETSTSDVDGDGEENISLVFVLLGGIP